MIFYYFRLMVILLLCISLFSCSSSEETEDIIVPKPIQLEAPSLSSFGFSSVKNGNQLIDDVKGEIIGDSVVECWIPNICEDKNLVPEMSHNGDTILFNDALYGGVF